jgi:hypothetical protein
VALDVVDELEEGLALHLLTIFLEGGSLRKVLDHGDSDEAELRVVGCCDVT